MDFYVLKPDGEMFGNKWAYGEIIRPANFGEAPYCPECSRRPIGMRKWLEPRRVRLSSSKPAKWGDVVWGAGFPFVVSDRFKHSYLRYGLTGIEEFLPPVKIARVGNKRADVFDRLPLYYPVVIELLGAKVNDVESNVVRKPQACQYCRGDVLSIDQVVIQESSWRGSDIFEARGLYGVTLVTERFKEMVDKENLTNIRLVSALEFNYDYRFGEST
jgi:hypothetical protein